MQNKTMNPSIRKKIVLFLMTLTVSGIFVLGSFTLLHFDRYYFFEHKAGVSLATLENVKTFGNSSLTGDGRVVVHAKIPHERVERFIKDYGFVQFDMRYTGTCSESWSDREYELWVLQDRVFGTPPLRYRRFPRASNSTLPPDSDVYFLHKRVNGRTKDTLMVLEKQTGTFWGYICY